MSVDDKLLILQDTDSRIRQMERELHDIPAKKKEELTRLDGHTKAVAEAKEQLKGLQVGLKGLEGTADSQRQKIVKFRQQQLELKTNKEFKAMEDEIKVVNKDISGVEDQEIVVMEKIETIKADIAEKEKDLKEEESVVMGDIKALDERAARIAEELATVRASRQEATKGIEAKWLIQYERIFAAKDKAFVPLEGGICGGCHMRLPPAVVHSTRRRTDIVFCDYCGRMLYLKES